MIQWGINALNHGSSLAVFANGQLISNSVDKTRDNPHKLISDAMLRGWEPDHIFWYENPWLKKARQIRAGQYTTAMDMSVLPKHHLKKWGLGYAPITYTPHHGSHAAAGYYTSPFNHCAVVVLDAIGEFECATIWNCHHGEMTKVWSRSYPHSLGLFYSAFTQMLGLQPIRDEYLLQQMAEQGDAEWYKRNISDYFDDGVLKLNYNFHRGVLNWTNEPTNLQEQCDIAAAVQWAFEKQIELIMTTARLYTNADCLVYMGGCAMNSTANKKIVEPMWKYRWSLPNPGDASSSIGAVVYHTKQRVWRDWDPVKHIEINV
jgi:carbamoyltransferase